MQTSVMKAQLNCALGRQSLHQALKDRVSRKPGGEGPCWWREQHCTTRLPFGGSNSWTRLRKMHDAHLPCPSLSPSGPPPISIFCCHSPAQSLPFCRWGQRKMDCVHISLTTMIPEVEYELLISELISRMGPRTQTQA